MSSKRLRQIVKVFASVGLLSYREKDLALDQREAPRKLRLAFEELGPSFVKIGQILSTRSDILPAAYIEELSHLQSRVKPMTQEVVTQVLSQELAAPPEKFFKDFSWEPLASGSVAQTHRAVLLSGDEVVVKVQRPHLEEILAEDIQLLIKLSRRIPKGILPMVNLTEVFENLKQTLESEIDFRNEADAIHTFAALNKGIKCVGVPEVYDQYTTRHVLVEEYIAGLPINHYQELLEAGYDLEDIGRKLMLAFIKQVFKDGYFHGDPHPGNLLIKEGKIYFIDFGIMGQLDSGMRAGLNEILYSFTAQDVDGMTRSLLSITQFDTTLNRASLSQDVEEMLGRYSGIDLGSLSIQRLLEDLVQVFQKNGLKASSQLTVLEKAALQIEGIFREIAPQIDLMTLAKNYFLENMGPDMLSQVLNQESLLIELFYLIKNGKNIPRRLHQLMEQISNGRLVLNHDLMHFEERMGRVESWFHILILSILTAALFLSASIFYLSDTGQPISYGLLGCAILLIGFIFVKMIKK